MLFEDTAYISFIDVTLMFNIKLIKHKFDRCSRINILMKMKSKKKICDIQMRYNLLILESVEENNETTTNLVQSRTTAKATLWVWHLRLEHCHSTIIEKLKVLNKKILLLLNSYSLWHRHKTTHARISTYLNQEKNLNEEKKFLVFNSIATKIVVDKLTIIRRNDVYAHSLLLSSISNTKNRLRDKSNERVFELL